MTVTWWGTVRNELKLGDHLGRPLAVKSPEPGRGPRRDLAFLQARNEASRLSCAALAARVYGDIIIPRSSTRIPDADPRPQHSGWPTGKEGWSL